MGLLLPPGEQARGEQDRQRTPHVAGLPPMSTSSRGYLAFSWCRSTSRLALPDTRVVREKPVGRRIVA